MNKHRSEDYLNSLQTRVIIFLSYREENIEICKDIAADTMETFIKTLRSEKIDNDFAWLREVAKNKLFNFLKRSKKQELFPDESNLYDESYWGGSVENEGESNLEEEDLVNILKELLSTKEFKVWELHSAGYPNQEIADIFNISYGRVAVIKSNIRKKLRNYMSRDSRSTDFNS
ncbi:MAG: sigma-70 family RNA polymerase sigma factor [Bacteroidota bacterium]